MKLSFRFACILTSFLFGHPIVFSQTSTTISSVTRVTVSGQVSDGNEALAGASLYFPDLRIGARSDSAGNYIIRNIPRGRWLLEVSYLGHASVVESVDLNGNVQRNFTLRISHAENEAVTVTGVSSATSVRRTPIPVNILKREDFLHGSSTNLIDALSKTPGISQLSTGPAISKPFIRGLGYNRVVVVNDGVRQEGQQWGDEHGIEIDEYNVGKAEILKGPASLMYGSDALAGVVHFISVLPATEGTIKGNLFGTYQSNNQQRGTHLDLSGNKNGFIWGLNGSLKAAEDYKNKYDGKVYNSDFSEKNAGGYVGLNKSWGFTHLLLTYFDQEPGLVEGDRDAVTGDLLKTANGIPRQSVRHFKAALDNSFKIGADRLSILLAWQRNGRQEFGNAADPSEKSLYFDLKTLNYNLQYHFAELSDWKTTIGINGMQQGSRNRGIEVLIPEYDGFDIGAFVYTQKRIGQINLSGGVRFDNRLLNFDSFKKNYSNFSGSAGLSYEASSQLTLKLNVARGFRAPSVPELASNGAHEGTNRFEYGERNLKSETSLQVDAGLELSTEHISASAAVFYNHMNNFIYYRKLASENGGDSIIMDGAEQYFGFRFDQQNASLYGAEFNIDIHPHPLDWLHIENSFSWVRGILSSAVDGSKNLPSIPSARMINQLRADFGRKGKAVKNLYLNLELETNFKQNNPFTAFDTETATAGYSLLNAGFGGDLVRKGKTLFSIYAAANNITDVAYQNHLSRLKYTSVNTSTGRSGVYNMGRNFSLKVNIPFEFSL
ncbi:MAG: TonB-dependent receptor [Gemmatimonadaceae bacterium]|nr:TonB-dependent receptor [Chitinophagaceae bacterium]